MAFESLYPVVLSGLVVGTGIVLYLLVQRARSSRLPYPPGPPGVHILGNLFDIPKQDRHIVYSNWAKEYDSDVIHLSVLGKHLIVVDTLEAATDLLEKRSSVSCDRPESVMLNDLMGLSWPAGFLSYSPRVRDLRKTAQLLFNPDSTKRYHGIETTAARELLQRLLKNNNTPGDNLRHMAGKTIIRITYGFNIKPQNDPFIKMAEHALYGISSVCNTGSYVVDLIPILRYIPDWFPGAQFKRDAKIWRKYIADMRDVPYDLVRKARNSEAPIDYEISSDSAAFELLDEVLKKSADPVYMEDIIKSSLGTFYLAGADTTVCALITFVLAMVLYPDIQRKAQKVIDEVVGTGRLPNFEDREALAYIDAILLESFRWHPVGPLNLPHSTNDDIIYNGKFIPKGSILVTNNWSILNNEQEFPSPRTFDPERFLDKDGKLNSKILDPTILIFGSGRRICPGRFMAKDTMWITMASILASLNIEKKIGSDGKPIVPDEKYMAGLISYPEPFVCDFKPRSKEHEALIEASF
ncbi:cytochrome P450 [Abortiporus biennis]|nr:cytochrome P450 [Abortiporus biennis]